MVAKRELYEKTGTEDFTLKPVFKYSFEVEGKKFLINYQKMLHIQRFTKRYQKMKFYVKLINKR